MVYVTSLKSEWSFFIYCIFRNRLRNDVNGALEPYRFVYGIYNEVVYTVCGSVSECQTSRRQWLMWTVRHLRLKTCCEVDPVRPARPSGTLNRPDCVTSYRCLLSTTSPVAAAAVDGKWRHDVTYCAPVLSHMPPTASSLSFALYFAPHPRRRAAAEARWQVTTHDNDTSPAFYRRPTIGLSCATFMSRQ